MNEKYHNCKILDSDKHSLSVVNIELNDKNRQWFLVNNKDNTAECILYCPYCGFKLTND